MSSGGHNKLSSDSINEYLINRNIVMIGDYVDCRTKTIFEHTDCNRSWSALPSRVRQGSGCPHCSGHFPLSYEIINNRLEDSNRDIIMIGSYTSMKKKSLFKHLYCDHEWMAVVQGIINGKGCPKCAKHGYNSLKSGWAYILKFDNFLKFGITNSLNVRMSHLKKNGHYDLEFSKYFENGKIPLNWENEVKQIFGGNYVSKDKCPRGFTETLSLNHMNDLKTLLENWQ